MRKIIIGILCLLSTSAFGQSTAEQVQPGTLQVVSGHAKFVPLSTTNPLPVSVSIGTSGISCPSCTNGQLLIGNGSTGSFNINTLTPGTGITVTNGPGTVTVSAATSSGVTLGTSASVTNPQKSGDITTGIDSTGVGLVQFSSSGTNEMTIGTSSILMAPNVAIGTSATPVFTLQVQGNGTYTATTGTGGLALKNATVPTKELYMGYDSALGTNGSGYIQAVNVGIANTNLLLEPSGGHILIGGTADNQLLNVYGNQFINGGIEIQNSGGGSAFWVSALASGSVLALGGVGGSPPASGAININNGGGVGIGTNAPLSLLSVAGSAAIGTYGGGSSAFTAPSNGLIISGSVGIGTNSPTTGASLDLKYNTNAMLLPVGTTTQRPTGIAGMLRYNSTTSLIEAFQGSSWSGFSGGSGGTPTCGTGCSSVTAGSTDLRGSMTVTALATSAVLNFSGTLGYTPFCSCSGSLTTTTASCTNTNATLTASLSVGVTGDVITWQCPQ